MTSPAEGPASTGNNNNSGVRAMIPIPKELVVDNAEHFEREIDLHSLQARSSSSGPRRSNRQHKSTVKLAQQVEDTANTSGASEQSSSNTLSGSAVTGNRKRSSTKASLVVLDNSSSDSIDGPNKRRRTSTTSTKKGENVPYSTIVSGVVREDTPNTANASGLRTPSSTSTGTGSSGPKRLILTCRKSPDSPSAAIGESKQAAKVTPSLAEDSIDLDKSSTHRRPPRTAKAATTRASKCQKDKDNDKGRGQGKRRNSNNGNDHNVASAPTRRSGRVTARNLQTSKSPAQAALEERLRRHDNHGVVRTFFNGDTAQPPNADDHQAVVEDIIKNPYLMGQLVRPRELVTSPVESAPKPSQEQETNTSTLTTRHGYSYERTVIEPPVANPQTCHDAGSPHTGDTTENEEGISQDGSSPFPAHEIDTQEDDFRTQEQVYEAVGILLSMSSDTRSISSSWSLPSSSRNVERKDVTSITFLTATT